MNKAQDRGRLDWMVELAGALAPALAAAFAAASVAPVYGRAIALSALVAGCGAFAAAWLALRMVRPEPRRLALPAFGGVTIDEELLLDQPLLDELLLDQPWLNAQPRQWRNYCSTIRSPRPPPIRAWCNYSPTAGCPMPDSSGTGSTGTSPLATGRRWRQTHPTR